MRAVPRRICVTPKEIKMKEVTQAAMQRAMIDSTEERTTKEERPMVDTEEEHIVIVSNRLKTTARMLAAGSLMWKGGKMLILNLKLILF